MEKEKEKCDCQETLGEVCSTCFPRAENTARIVLNETDELLRKLLKQVKEYIERAEKIMSEEFHGITEFDAYTDRLLTVAQMLQREEHFNKSKE